MPAPGSGRTREMQVSNAEFCPRDVNRQVNFAPSAQVLDAANYLKVLVGVGTLFCASTDDGICVPGDTLKLTRNSLRAPGVREWSSHPLSQLCRGALRRQSRHEHSLAEAARPHLWCPADWPLRAPSRASSMWPGPRRRVRTQGCPGG